jgi:hypothetical protein
MKITKPLLILLCFWWATSVQAEIRYFFNLPLVGSELEGPRPTSDWDLGLERGLSITPGFGVQFDQQEMAFDILLEWFNHSSVPLISTDEVLEVDGYLVKFIARAKIADNWRIYGGLGFGNADVSANFDSCRSYSGCPAGPWAYPPISSKVGIDVMLVGVSYVAGRNSEYFLGFERVKSDALGFRDIYGTPYADDELDLPAAVIGMRLYF